MVIIFLLLSQPLHAGDSWDFFFNGTLALFTGLYGGVLVRASSLPDQKYKRKDYDKFVDNFFGTDSVKQEKIARKREKQFAGGFGIVFLSATYWLAKRSYQASQV